MFFMNYYIPTSTWLVERQSFCLRLCIIAEAHIQRSGYLSLARIIHYLVNKEPGECFRLSH